MLKRQVQPNFKSWSEKVKPHQEEVPSGILIDPPRQSQSLEETQKDQPRHHYKRPSVSGPLIHHSRWAKSGRNQDDAPNMSTGADLSILSSLVAAISLLADGCGDETGSSQPDMTNLVSSRFPGSFNEVSEYNWKQDIKHQGQGHSSSNKKEDGRIKSKDHILPGNGSKGNNIHNFGSLLGPSRNVDQMLEEHNHEILEVDRLGLRRRRFKKI